MHFIWCGMFWIQPTHFEVSLIFLEKIKIEKKTYPKVRVSHIPAISKSLYQQNQFLLVNLKAIQIFQILWIDKIIKSLFPSLHQFYLPIIVPTIKATPLKSPTRLWRWTASFCKSYQVVNVHVHLLSECLHNYLLCARPLQRVPHPPGPCVKIWNDISHL